MPVLLQIIRSGRNIMHKSLITITAVFLLALPISANADNGVITKASAYSADATTQRLEAAIKSRGFMVFGRLNHAAAAKDFGLSMPYSIVVVFGNPKLGTPSFIHNPPLAIDLPLKALVWEDKDGKVWLSYNSSKYLYETIYARHGQPFTGEMVNLLEGGLAKLMDEVTKK
jgi:uncharacterized protein (DUF302 family)